jgi:hypothetical protein
MKTIRKEKSILFISHQNLLTGFNEASIDIPPFETRDTLFSLAI